jgi:YfiH family protein
LNAPIELATGARVLFTTRASGNLSSRSGDGRERAGRHRERLRERLGLGSLAHARQVHGVVVSRVDGTPAIADAGGGEADGQATALPKIGLVVFTADCLPVALASEDAVAMLHAGWRGLAGGVLEKGVRALRELSGEGEVVAVIGPGAGGCCYEVGPEVHAAFGNAPRRQHLDLKAAAGERLRAAGVCDVRDLELCTICDERFFSHRREGARAGRQAGLAWLQ